MKWIDLHEITIHQDVDEFFRFLMDHIDRNTNTCGQNLFDIKIESTVTWANGKYSSKSETYLGISFPVATCSTVLKAFDNKFNRPEKIEE